jgi:hypothetical protein
VQLDTDGLRAERDCFALGRLSLAGRAGTVELVVRDAAGRVPTPLRSSVELGPGAPIVRASGVAASLTRGRTGKPSRLALNPVVHGEGARQITGENHADLPEVSVVLLDEWDNTVVGTLPKAQQLLEMACDPIDIRASARLVQGVAQVRCRSLRAGMCTV